MRTTKARSLLSYADDCRSTGMLHDKQNRIASATLGTDAAARLALIRVDAGNRVWLGLFSFRMAYDTDDSAVAVPAGDIPHRRLDLGCRHLARHHVDLSAPSS